MVKYWFELMSLYQFFTQNSIPEPKSTQNHPKTCDFDQFFKKSDFYKNRQKSPGGGTGRRPFKYVGGKILARPAGLARLAGQALWAGWADQAIGKPSEGGFSPVATQGKTKPKNSGSARPGPARHGSARLGLGPRIFSARVRKFRVSRPPPFHQIS